MQVLDSSKIVKEKAEHSKWFPIFQPRWLVLQDCTRSCLMERSWGQLGAIAEKTDSQSVVDTYCGVLVFQIRDD